MSSENEAKFVKIQSPEGCHDILPQDQVFFSLIKKVIRRRSRLAGISRITPCLFEEKRLFEHSMGVDSDAASKELYTLNSKSGKKDYALRPELTAGIIRAYVEHGMASWPQPVRLYAFDSVFRHDRPQKNRYRQFYQWSTEIIGERDPGLDAQMIHLAYAVLKDLKIQENIVVKINTLGSQKERQKYVEALKDYFYDKERVLSFESQERIETNPLRILDSKDEDDKIICEMAPKFSLFQGDETKAYFKEVCELLEEVEVPYEIDETLVRGLDYYSDTVFEFLDTTDTGSQLTLIGGGRYDGLVERLGGVSTPAFGFGMGIDRIINRMKDKKFRVPTKDKIQVYVSQLGSMAKKKALKLLEDLHDRGVQAMGAMGTPSMKAQLKNANKFDADWALIMGQIEVLEGNVILRNMNKGSQETVPYDGIVDRVVELIGEDNLQKVDFFELNSLEIVEDFDFDF